MKDFVGKYFSNRQKISIQKVASPAGVSEKKKKKKFQIAEKSVLHWLSFENCFPLIPIMVSTSRKIDQIKKSLAESVDCCLRK